MKKIVSIVASIFMALALIGGGVFLLHDIEKTSIVQEDDLTAKATVNGNWKDYDSGARWVTDSDGYIMIQTPADLAHLAVAVNKGHTWAGTSDLVASSNFKLYPENGEYIDLSAHYWTSIGNADHPFKGVFDGNGKQIIGLNIDYTKSKDSSTRRLGLFGHTNGGYNAIKDLTVSGDIRLYNSANKGSSYVGTYGIGGIVGVNYSPIKNCVSNVNIYYVRQSSDSNHKKYDLESHVNIGGIAGWSDLYGNITNCTYSGEIHFNDKEYEVKTYDGSKYRFRLGGMAGCAYNTDFKDCLFNGKILVHEPDDMDQLYVGGIIACYNVANAEVSDCISKGEISLDGHIEDGLDDDNDDGGKYCSGAIGGIVGYVHHTYSTATALYIKRCHNFSKIFQYISDYTWFHVGGILGYTRFKTEVQNCSNFAYIFNKWDDLWEVDWGVWSITHTASNVSEKEAIGTGGIVGTIEAELGMSYCINYGSIDGLAYIGYVGGVLGHKRTLKDGDSEINFDLNVKYCMNYGSINTTSKPSSCGTLFGYLRDKDKKSVSINHCLSFVSGKICGTGSSVKPGESNNCGSVVEDSDSSRDKVLDRTNYKSSTSFWDGKLCTYYPNVSGDSLNDKLYISPVDNQSLIYKHLGTDATENAIMPLSLISKTTVTYYCGDDQKFYQNDTNVGLSQRGRYSSGRYGNALSTYIDRDPDSNSSYPDRILTLRGVGVSDEKIFTCKYYQYDSYTTDPESLSSVAIEDGGLVEISSSDGNIYASISKENFSYNLGTITIILKPDTKLITIKETNGNGDIKIDGVSVSGDTFDADLYRYSGGTTTERSLSVNVTASDNYQVKSIEFDSDPEITNDEKVNPFSTTSNSFEVCDISNITINYEFASKMINFYYKLPGQSEDTNCITCDAGGIYETSAIKDAITGGYITFKYNDTISLYTNPGYYIKNIWAKYRAEKWVEKDGLHTINGKRTVNTRLGIVTSVTWKESDSKLIESSLQTFLQRNFLNTDGWDISAVYIEYDYTQFNTGVYVDAGTSPVATDTSFDLSKTLTVGNDKGIKLGYKYGVSAGKTTDALTGCFELGRSTEASPHSTSLNLDDNKNAQISIKLSDFVGTSAKIYTTQNTGSSAYSPTAGPLYIYLNKQDSGVQLKVAAKNMAKYAGHTDKYYPVKNSTDDVGLDTDIYGKPGNPIGGLTYFTESGTNKINTNVSAISTITFSANAMSGFKFSGITFNESSNPTKIYNIDTSATAIDVLAKAVQDKFGTNKIYYDQLNNLTVYGYYDINKYEIIPYYTIDEGQQQKYSGDDITKLGYFSWTYDTNSANKRELDYFNEITFEINLEKCSENSLEFLGLYLLDDAKEKSLTFETTYTFINYAPSREDSKNINFLVKFATKPTSSSTPPQSNQVIEVSSIDHLIWLSNQVNSGNLFENYIIKQTANIDFNGKFIFPIGTENHPFKGIYDGQGYVIKNLKLIYGDTAIGTNVGLFGYTDGATIKNLTLVDGSVTGFDNVGAVVGYAKNTTFENVINQSCEVKAITYAYYDIYGDEITNGNTSGTLVDEYGFGTYSYIKYKSDRAYGGIVGRSENSTFFACGARAEIKKLLKKYNTTTAQNYSTAKGRLAYARGIIGSADSNTTLNQCYYFGDLSILSENYLTNQSSLSNCFYNDGENQSLYGINIYEYDATNQCWDAKKDQDGNIKVYNGKVNELKEIGTIDPQCCDIWFQIVDNYELKIFYWS